MPKKPGTVEQIIEYAQPYTIELERGASGKYRWSIKVHAEDNELARAIIRSIDTWLKETFGED